MADDITARILLSVEYADAVQKCKDVEVGLEDITAARQRDVEAVQKSTRESTENAQAMEREAAAAEKVAKATKKKNEAQKTSSTPERKQSFAEMAGMSEAEWEEQARRNAEASARARAKVEKQWQDIEARQGQETVATSSPERATAIQELNERKRVLKEVQFEQSRMSQLNAQSLDEEIKDQKILLANKRKQLAIEKEIRLQRKLNDVRDQLNDPAVRRDPQKFNQALKLRDKYEQQSMLNTREILEAERNLRNVNGAIAKTNKIINTSNSVFGKAARGIGRSLGHIARLGGRSLGMEMTTEGMAGPGGAFMAGALAIGGVTMLARSILQMRDERDVVARSKSEREQTDLRETVERIKTESHNRAGMVETLRELAKAEKLTQTQQLQQADILEKLNRVLGDTAVSLDNFSGKINNASQIEWDLRNAEARKQMQVYDTQMKNLQAEISRNEAYLADPKISQAIKDANKKSFENIEKGKGKWWGGFTAQAETQAIVARSAMPAYEKTKKELADRTINRTLIKEAETRITKDREELGKITQEYQKLKQSISIVAEEKYWKQQNAEIYDQIEALREVAKARAKASNSNRQAYKLRDAEMQKYAQKIKELESNTTREIYDNIQSLSNDTRLYNSAMGEYRDNLRELETIKQKRAEYEAFNYNVSRHLYDMRREIKLQDMVNAGLGEAAELERLRWERAKKVTREGWSPKQAQEWAELQAYQQDQANRTARVQSIAGFMQRESFKYRDTTTAAVMANSLEGVRLQNRQLIANTPEKALLNVNQKQYSMLEQIKKGIDKLALKGGSSSTIQTQRV